MFLSFYIGIFKIQINNNLQELRITMLDQSRQRTVSEFSRERKNYDYVSFENLYINTSLYYGAKIYQWGHIKRFDLNHKYLLVALDGNDESRIVKLKYEQSKFERGDVDLRINTPIKFYGNVKTTERYISEKGLKTSRPVISADFIQTKINGGEKFGIV